MNKEPRSRIALLGMGVIGGGPLGNGLPTFADLFHRLSTHYDITFYSFSRIDLSRVPSSVRVKQPGNYRIPGRLKYLLLAIRLIISHVRSPYQMLFCVAAYPTGRYGAMLGKLLRKPVVVQYVALEAVCLPEIGDGNLCRPWLKKITQWVAEQATELVMLSDFQRKIAEESLPTKRSIEVLPLRIVSQDYQYIKRRITFPVQFIHVAYYNPVKDQRTLFRAFGEVAKKIDCHLTIVGSGFDTPEVTTLLNELNIAGKVTCKGTFVNSRMPAQFHDAHILLHTSLFESCGVVIQEAMASGVAVCGTRVGMLDDNPEFALVVPPRDHAQLAKKILELVRDENAYDKLTSAAHAWIVRHDASWASENYRALIERVLNRDGRVS